jgi:hypothetical protein
MDLAKVAARLRLRSGFEAVDLGVLLARRFAWPMHKAWMLCVFPFFALAIGWALLTNQYWFPLLVLWWLKPLYARVPLHILSRSFFGDVPTPQQTAKALRGYWLKPAILLELTVFRFAFLRGFSIFVRDLEGSSYSASAQRLKVLINERTRTTGYWLYFTAFCFEWIFYGAFIFLLAVMIPEAVDVSVLESLATLFENEQTPAWLLAYMLATYGLSVMLVEPLLIAGNFGLYISRRVELEGWDIELAFRKLATRLESAARHGLDKAAMLLVAMGLVFSLQVPSPAFAEDVQTSDDVSQSQSQPDPKALLTTILESPDFGEEKTTKNWTLRDRFQKTPRDPRQPIVWLPALAQALKFLAWLLAAIGLTYVLFLLVRHTMKRLGLGGVNKVERPQWDQSVALIDEQGADGYALPDDIIAHARRAWSSGDEVRALNLLYLGTLEVLEKRYDLALDPGQTAYECVRIVRRAGGPHELVAAVANAWTSLLFARRRPSDEAIEALFLTWQNTFAAGRTP